MYLWSNVLSDKSNKICFNIRNMWEFGSVYLLAFISQFTKYDCICRFLQIYIYNIIVVYALKHISRTYPDHYPAVPAPTPSLVYQSLIHCTSTVTTENYSKSCLKDNNSYLCDNFKSKYYETLSPSWF